MGAGTLKTQQEPEQRQQEPARQKLSARLVKRALEQILTSDRALEAAVRWADSDSSLSYRVLDYVSQDPSSGVGDRLVTHTVYYAIWKLAQNLKQIRQSSSPDQWENFIRSVEPFLAELRNARNSLEALYFGLEVIYDFGRLAPDDTQRILGNSLTFLRRFSRQAGIETEGAPPESSVIQTNAPILKLHNLCVNIESELVGRTGGTGMLPPVPLAPPPSVEKAEAEPRVRDEVEAEREGREKAKAKRQPEQGSAGEPPRIDASLQVATSSEPPGEPPPRYFNYIFYRQTSQGGRGESHDQSRPLRVEQKYQLEISVGLKPQGLKTDEPPRPFREPRQSGPVEILVILQADPSDFDIPNPVRRLILPPSGNTAADQNAVFSDVEPKRAVASPDDMLSLYIRLYYEFNLLEGAEITAEVVGNGVSDHKSRFNLDRAVELRQQRIEQQYYDFDDVRPRSMHIDITRGQGSYKLTFTLRKDIAGEDEERGVLLALTGYARIPESELEDILVAVRKALLGIELWKCFDAGVQCPDSYKFASGMRSLMTLGTKLWTRIFKYDLSSSLCVIGSWLETHPLPDRAIIQISHDGSAPQFVLPWNFLCDGDPPGDSEQPEYRRMWGVRYSIEQRIPGNRAFTDAPLTTYDPLRTTLLVWQFPESGRQKRLLQYLSKLSGGRLAPATVISDKDTAIQFLKAGSAHLIHFFAHGHTRVPNAPQFGFSEADFVKLYQELPDDSPVKKSWQETYEEILAKRYISDDSWIKLTSGMLLLDALYGFGDRIQLRNRPVVFLNMCESAQVTPSLAESFIHFFANRGAATVIGTECPMRSLFAHFFATAFITRWLSGVPAGEAILDARLEFIRKGNPMGLAYTLFGSATTRIDPAPFDSVPDLSQLDTADAGI